MSETVCKYLHFTLSGRQYAFDLAQVLEVVEQPAIWPIPLAPQCYHGAMNFHGTIVAVKVSFRMLPCQRRRPSPSMRVRSPP